jgi:outer membrane receptor protein involved in Fe transport
LQDFRTEHSDGFTVLNFRAGYHFTDDIKLSFLLNNAFNEEYSTRPGLLAAPRNLTMRLDFKF